MKKLKIGITCYPTVGGSGVVATELGKCSLKKVMKFTLFHLACLFV